uniref:Uncharacterized protein n=1 Tax=Desulfatirhabdium butyrativorans TaxID=340467 RepID=A0A7C4RUD3_9BACT
MHPRLTRCSAVMVWFPVLLVLFCVHVCFSQEEDGWHSLDIGRCLEGEGEGVWSRAMDGEDFQFGGTDRYAVYWRMLMPRLDLSKYPDAHFEIRGQFPHATYFSFHVNTKRTRFLNKMTDEDIEPDSGFSNPFRKGDEYRKGQTYTISVIQDGQQGKVSRSNLLVIPEAGSREEEYVVLYRMYEPLTGRDGGVTLPGVFLVAKEGVGDENRWKEECCKQIKGGGGVPDFLFGLEHRLDKRSQRLAKRTKQQAILYHPPDPIEFIIGDDFFGMVNRAFPAMPDFMIKHHPTGANMDTRYLAAFLDPSKDVTVIRFKPPVAGKDVRYWSVSVYQPFNGLMYAYATANYRDFQPDPDGLITIVFTDERQKPAFLYDPVMRQPPSGKYNWMPYGSKYPLIWFRYLLPSPSFQESPVYYSGDPYDGKAIRAHMKAFYPKAAYFTSGEFETSVQQGTLLQQFHDR